MNVVGRQRRPELDDDGITGERIDRALVKLAYIIASTGEEQFAPLLERLERELEAYRNRPDPVEHARRILEAHTIDGSLRKAIP